MRYSLATKPSTSSTLRSTPTLSGDSNFLDPRAEACGRISPRHIEAGMTGSRGMQGRDLETDMGRCDDFLWPIGDHNPEIVGAPSNNSNSMSAFVEDARLAQDDRQSKWRPFSLPAVKRCGWGGRRSPGPLAAHVDRFSSCPPPTTPSLMPVGMVMVDITPIMLAPSGLPSPVSMRPCLDAEDDLSRHRLHARAHPHHLLS